MAGFVAIASFPAWVAVAHRVGADDGCRDLGLFVNGGPSVTVPVSAPHGGVVDWRTWDAYVGRESMTQASERVRVDVLDGGTVVASWATPDLADRVREASASGTVSVRDRFTAVRVSHLSDGSSPNSVRARVCAAPSAPPVTTTTTTTAVVELIPPQTVEATETTVPTSVPTTVASTVETPTATPTVATPSFTG
jgi:hypothetical protein